VFSSVAGIGGGAMMTPILISIFGFNLAAAKMLSHICVFGNVCAQVTCDLVPSIHYLRSYLTPLSLRLPQISRHLHAVAPVPKWTF
jgi:hypothetical protein